MQFQPIFSPTLVELRICDNFAIKASVTHIEHESMEVLSLYQPAAGCNLTCSSLARRQLRGIEIYNACNNAGPLSCSHVRGRWEGQSRHAVERWSNNEWRMKAAAWPSIEQLARLGEIKQIREKRHAWDALYVCVNAAFLLTSSDLPNDVPRQDCLLTSITWYVVSPSLFRSSLQAWTTT